MNKQSTSIKFNLQNVSKNGKRKILVVYRAQKSVKKISTGIEVDPDWSFETNTDDLIKYKLQYYIKKINEAELFIMKMGKEVTVDEVFNILKKPKIGQTSDNIIEFIRFWSERNKDKKSESTRYNYELVAKYLERWCTTIIFRNMDKTNLEAFEQWLIEQDFLNSTINQLMRSLFTIIKIAKEENIDVNSAWEIYVPVQKKTESETITLSREELEKLLSLNLSGNLDKVRDMFAFACGTGMRYSDIIKLEWNSIKADKIVYFAVKTGQRTEVFLNSTSKAILKKRRLEANPLPKVSNQQCNVLIKEVCKLAGFNEMITMVEENGAKKKYVEYPKWECVQFHTGRRTFATLASLAGIPDNEVMKITGHKRFDNYKKYIGYSESDKASFMQLWDK